MERSGTSAEPGAPHEPGTFDEPAPWSGAATAGAIAIYVGGPWLAASVASWGFVPYDPATSVVYVIASVVVTALWIRHVARRSSSQWWTEVGLHFRWRDLAIGPAVAAVVFAVGAALGTLLVWRLGPAAEDDAWQVSARWLGRPALLATAVVGVTLVPIAEEVLFRAMLLRSLARRMGVADRIAVSSALFGAMHLHPDVSWQANLTTFVLTGVFGAAMCVVVRRTNRLGPAIIAHAVTNVVAFSFLLADL